MKIILTIILMNGYVNTYEYKVDKIDARLCDALFDKHTYVHTSRFSTARNKTGTFYKSKEVFAYTCNYKTT